MSTKKQSIPIEESEEEMFDFDSVTPIGSNKVAHVSVSDSSGSPEHILKDEKGKNEPPVDSIKTERSKRIDITLPVSLVNQLKVYRLLSKQTYSSLIKSLLIGHFNSPEFSEYAEKIEKMNRILYNN